MRAEEAVDHGPFAGAGGAGNHDGAVELRCCVGRVSQRYLGWALGREGVYRWEPL